MPSPSIAVPAARLSVLVVDPNKLNRLLVRNALQRGGHVVHGVDTIDEALAALASHRPDRLLIDATAEHPRLAALLSSFAPAQIIAMTTKQARLAERVWKPRGVDAILTKPILVSRLMKALQPV
ncbi:MAG: response regulator [Kofleriaceae bacterium]